MMDTAALVGDTGRQLMSAFRPAAEGAFYWMADPKNSEIVRWGAFGLAALASLSFLPTLLSKIPGFDNSLLKGVGTLALGFVLASGIGNWAANGFKMDKLGDSFTSAFKTIGGWAGVKEETYNNLMKKDAEKPPVAALMPPYPAPAPGK